MSASQLSVPGVSDLSVAGVPVDPTLYDLVHKLHADVIDAIDSALTWDQLGSPGVNYTLVRPIMQRLDGVASMASAEAKLGLGDVLYALMANRVQFISLAGQDLSYEPLQSTRADFCEMLAIKVLRDCPPGEETDLARELLRPLCALDGAPDELVKNVDDDASESSSALELAIVAKAKRFISQPVVQHLLAEIQVGKIVYVPAESKGHRKHKHNNDLDVYEYNPYRAGWLDYGRLRVPRWRHWIEFGTFATLIALFVFTLATRHLKNITVVEVVFVIFTSGFILDELAAANEVGWTVYVANAWNAFDLTFITIFLLYLVLRIVGLAQGNRDTADLAFDILACGACILFPRLVFFLIRNNVVVLALRGMVTTFVGFMLLTAVAFSGVVFCLWRLAQPNSAWTVRRIVWLMLQIWFGSSGLSFQESSSFHPIFGPIILISYAALCSTLLITMLISILSNYFASVQENAQEEHLFQRAVSTLENLTANPLFAYPPPFNLVSMLILRPLSSLAPDAWEGVDVALVKIVNAPILLAIATYERHRFRRDRRAIKLSERGLVGQKERGLFDNFLGGGAEVAVHAAFDLAPPVVAAPAQDEEQGAGTPMVDKKRRISNASAQGTQTFARLLRTGERNVSQAEFDELRQSQKRLEEMLAKVLAVTGG